MLMESALGHALSRFDETLSRFRAVLEPDPVLTRMVFEGTEDWANLLTYKLVPHLEGEGCLVVAVTGGTNTGKSTVFNLLAGKDLSPVVPTAAATRRPVVAANNRRAEQCLAGKLVPEFQPCLLEKPQTVSRADVPPDLLYVAVAPRLPDRVVLLDTPDIDSIEKSHWVTAGHIRAAGDVLVAVLTGEKYRDDRVVEFFRKAGASGRMVLPLMNKASSDKAHTVARRQLAEFSCDVGFDAPCFVLEHEDDLRAASGRPIVSLDGATDLMSYLLGLDVARIKEDVYQHSVRHFAERAGAFLDRAASVGAVLRAAATEFEDRAARYAAMYDPAPGCAIGGLFHEFVQSKRGPLRRWIGTASTGLVRGASAAGRILGRALGRRGGGEARTGPRTDVELRAAHATVLERITRELLTSYIETGRNFREPAAHLVAVGLEDLDVEAAVAAVVNRVLKADSLSEAFREHAHRLLETWWNDHKGRRRALEALDALLAVTPAAIAAPISLYTAGVGVSEAVVVAGPVIEQFAARVIEYQFGDALFDFLSPWKAEQQSNLQQTLRDCVAFPILSRLHKYLEAFEGELFQSLQEWRGLCCVGP